MKLFIYKILGKIYRILKNSNNISYQENLRKKYNIPLNFRFNGENIFFYGEGKLTIGNNCYIGNGSTISLSKGYYVKIGNNVVIGANTVVCKNIPSNSIVGGVPGKIIKKENKNELYL